MNFSLPAFPVNERNKLALAILVGFYTVGAYAVIGEIANTMDAALLPLTALDRAIPLVPWTFWIYASVYCIYAFSCIFQRNLEIYAKFLWGYIFAYTFCALFFLIYPTTFPREVYPIGAGVSPEQLSVSEAALGWFRTVDHPTNCLPSMHVGSAVMSAAPFYGQRPVVFAVFCVWAVAIAITTITTKQHYVLDVVAGATYGMFVHIAFQNWVPFRRQSGR